MAVTATPIFGQAPKYNNANVTATTTDYTGATTTNIVTLLTAGSNGAKVLEIILAVPVTSVAGQGIIWVDDGGGGTNRFYDTLPIQAITVSTTQQPFRVSKKFENFYLESGDIVKVGITTTNNPTVFTAEWMNY